MEGKDIDRIWNYNFDSKVNVNGKTIIVGEQDFDSGTISIKEEEGNIIFCPMYFDKKRDIYFWYDGEQVFLKYI